MSLIALKGGRCRSDGDRGFDRWVRVVVQEFEVFKGEVGDVPDVGIDAHGGQGSRLAFELELSLVDVIFVKVEVAEGVDEVACFQPADLGDHDGEQRVAGDVEGDSEEEIGAALVELAGKFAALGIDVELEEAVAGRQGHEVKLAGIPGADHEASAGGVVLDLFDDLFDLVDAAAFGRFPVGPLGAVDAAEVAVFVGPFIPDADFVFVEVSGVGVAFEKPEQLVDNGAQVQFLGRQAGEAFAQVEARLGSEDGIGAGAGAVAAELAVVEYVLEQVEILLHGKRAVFRLGCWLSAKNVEDSIEDLRGLCGRPGRSCPRF